MVVTCWIFDEEENQSSSKEQLPSDAIEAQISIALEDGSKKKLIREEIIMSLQIVLERFSSLQFSPQKNEIKNYIIKECENKCSIHLDEEDVSQLWVR